MEDYIDFLKELLKSYDTNVNFEKAFNEGLFEFQEISKEKGNLCRMVIKSKCWDIEYDDHKKFKEVNEKYRNAKDDKEKKKLDEEIDKLLSDELSFMSRFFIKTPTIFFSLNCGTKKFKQTLDEYFHKGFTERLVIKKAGKYAMAVDKPWWYEKK